MNNRLASKYGAAANGGHTDPDPLAAHETGNESEFDPAKVVSSALRVSYLSRPSAQARSHPQLLALENQRVEQFVAILSHELRSSLHAVNNALWLLRMQAGESPEGQQARLAIHRQVARMTRLVEDLAEVARLRNGQLRLCRERIDLRIVVKRAVETMSADIEQHHHRLTVDLPQEPVWLQADAGRLEQVFVNLLANAVKYTDRKGAIAVNVQQENTQVRARITDSGIGIAPEILPRVFDLFVQGELSSRRSEIGLGVGLALVRSLVELHGGSVTAASAGVGQGSEFTVCLPLAAALSAATGKPRTEAQSARGGRNSESNG